MKSTVFFFGGGEGTCASNVSIGTDYILNSASRVPRRVMGIDYPEPSAPLLPILVDHRTGHSSECKDPYKSIQGC